MERELLYVELQDESLHRGPAWIALVKRSRSGRTVYFDGKALSRARGGGLAGNHIDRETGEVYWVSAPKKDGRDRHRYGGGPVQVEERALASYSVLRGLTELDPRTHPVVPNLSEPDMERLHRLENEPLTE